MKYTETGTYELKYTAIDECGNETEVIREVIVYPATATILYSDGTLIINSLGKNRESEIAEHGAVVKEYVPLDENNDYVLADANEQLWVSERSQITSAEFGSEVAPTSMAYWFHSCPNFESIDWTNIDASNVTSIRAIFANAAVTEIVLPSMPNLENLRYAFNRCESLTSVDFSQVGAMNITDISALFQGDIAIENIDLSGLGGTIDLCQNMFSNASASAPDMNIKQIKVDGNLDFSQATNSTAMFRGCTQLIGGQGTTYDSTKTDNAYAKIDGGSADPGYFTQA